MDGAGAGPTNTGTSVERKPERLFEPAPLSEPAPVLVVVLIAAACGNKVVKDEKKRREERGRKRREGTLEKRRKECPVGKSRSRIRSLADVCRTRVQVTLPRSAKFN